MKLGTEDRGVRGHVTLYCCIRLSPTKSHSQQSENSIVYCFPGIFSPGPFGTWQREGNVVPCCQGFVTKDLL